MATTSKKKPREKAHHRPRRWSAKVMEKSDAMDLERGVFKQKSPKRRRKSSPFRSAMSMLGTRQRDVLNAAKEQLRKLFKR